MSSTIAFHTSCEQSTSKMDVDWATLAAAYRLGFSTFRNSMSRLSQSLLFTRAFLNSHIPVDMMSQLFQKILEPKRYRQFTRLFSRLVKSSLGTRLIPRLSLRVNKNLKERGDLYCFLVLSVTESWVGPGHEAKLLTLS